MTWSCLNVDTSAACTIESHRAYRRDLSEKKKEIERALGVPLKEFQGWRFYDNTMFLQIEYLFNSAVSAREKESEREKERKTKEEKNIT